MNNIRTVIAALIEQANHLDRRGEVEAANLLTEAAEALVKELESAP